MSAGGRVIIGYTVCACMSDLKKYTQREKKCVVPECIPRLIPYGSNK